MSDQKTKMETQAFSDLSRELGPADTARFVNQFSKGSGDYTAERIATFAGRSVADLAAEIRAATAAPRQVPLDMQSTDDSTTQSKGE